MFLLRLPVRILSVGALNPEPNSAARVRAVRAYYESPGAQTEVRRVALSLRLTLFATSITAQKPNSKNQREPTMVRLGRREVQVRTSSLLADILPKLGNDPILDLNATFLGLLLTEAHLVIRFDQYARYSSALWRLTRKFNVEEYAQCILNFLGTEDLLLDAGYSLLLKQEAWKAAGGVEAIAVEYMMSDSVQDELVAIFERASATTLDAERKHQQDKRHETVKVTGCARASKNSILQRYLREREDALAAGRKVAIAP